MPEFHYQEMFPLGEDTTPYRKLTDKFVSTITVDGHEILKVEPEALSLLTAEAIHDISHLLRPAHLPPSPDAAMYSGKAYMVAVVLQWVSN